MLAFYASISMSQPTFMFPRTSWAVMKAVAKKKKAKVAKVEPLPTVTDYVSSLEKAREMVSRRGLRQTLFFVVIHNGPHLSNGRAVCIACSNQKWS